MTAQITLGISACLLGRKVRYDGGDALDPFLTGTWGRYVRYVPVCPEAEAGLGIPREPVRLTGSPGRPRLLGVRTGVDRTGQLEGWASRRLDGLAAEGLDGFVFKARSPSCGLRGVKLFDERGRFRRCGVGLFARAFQERFPLLPAAQDEDLRDPARREAFLMALFLLGRYRAAGEGAGSREGGLRGFHRREELCLAAFCPGRARRMGRLLLPGVGTPSAETAGAYESLLREAAFLIPTRAKQAAVLLRAAGRLGGSVTAAEREELTGLIARYRAGGEPLLLPLSLLRHFARRSADPYLLEQTYLWPAELELLLRCHP